ASASVRERVGAHVAAAACPTCETAEEALEEVREASELFWRDVGVSLPAREGAGGRPALVHTTEGRRSAGAPVGVVELALLFVRQDGVRLVELLEARLCPGVTGIAIGVVFGCQLPEGATDLLLRGILLHPQYLVVILVLSHLNPLSACHFVLQLLLATTTLAGLMSLSPFTKPISYTCAMTFSANCGLGGTTASASWIAGSNCSPTLPTRLIPSDSRLRMRPSLTAMTPGRIVVGSVVVEAAATARSRSS